MELTMIQSVFRWFDFVKLKKNWRWRNDSLLFKKNFAVFTNCYSNRFSNARDPCWCRFIWYETVLWIRSTDPMKGIDPMLNQLNYFLWIVSGQHSHISLNFRLFCIGKYKWSCYFYSIDIQLIQYAIETFILHFTALKAWRQFDVFINARSMRV